MSSLSFLCDIYAANIPTDILKQTNDLIRYFLWGEKTWRVAKKMMALRKENAGLEIPDLDTYIKAKKVKWLINIHFKHEERWNIIGKGMLKLKDGLFGQESFLLECSDTAGLQLGEMSPFYRTCLEAWCELQQKSKPLDKETILNQKLYGNFNIKIRNKPLFFPEWGRSGILKIGDVWNELENTFINGQDIFNKLLVKRNWIAEYESIKLAIPAVWKNTLRTGHPLEENDQCLQNICKVDINSKEARINGNIKEPLKIRHKEIYYALFYPQNIPGGIEKWNAILGRNIDITHASYNLTQVVSLNKYRDFSWKCLHRAVYSEVRLKQMGRSNGICKLCNKQEENTLHLLYFCQCINRIWEHIEIFIKEVFDIDIQIDPYVVLLGSNIGEDKSTKIKMNVINTLIQVGKWEIWKNRNNVKFGAQNTAEVNEIFCVIIKKCKLNLILYNQKKCINDIINRCISHM